MITTEIIDLIQYINSTCKVLTKFGTRDTAPNEYPLVQVRMVEDFETFKYNEKTLTIDLPLDLHIITSEDNELKALEVLERMLLKLNQFAAEKGHEFEGSGTPEYVDETNTFEISLIYKLKLIIQDT
jgi:hypothetical protein